jgi:hypothetical protein
MMGHLVDPVRLFSDMRRMGIRTTATVQPVTATSQPVTATF